MIKKTRWSVSVSAALSPGDVHTPWPRAHTHFLHVFKAHAERYRRRRRMAFYLMIGFIVGAFLLTSVSVSSQVGIWGVGLLAASWLLALLIWFGTRLRCPACRKRLEPARGLYCPQCGSDQFEHARHKRGPLFGRYPYCPSCDQRIEDPSNDDPRTYRIRGCTHCGVMLDENGL